MNKHVIGFPLEPYKQRYTEMLWEWENKAFEQAGLGLIQVWPYGSLDTAGNPKISDLSNGEVLDTIQRPSFSQQQVIGLISRHDPMLEGAPVYLSDFYTSGVDALFYSGFMQYRQLFSFCWAQTFDRFDFTSKRHLPWMRHYEEMVMSMSAGVFVACTEIADLIYAAFPKMRHKIHAVGLPFDSAFVRRLSGYSELIPLKNRTFDLAYTSRWDEEKNPIRFIYLARKLLHARDAKIVVCSGGILSNNKQEVLAARQLAKDYPDRFIIRENLSKAEYYRILGDTKVQFNCSSQDWISFTLLEALTLGCLPAYPMFRSFPQALGYQKAYLYDGHELGIIDVVESAFGCVTRLLDEIECRQGGLSHVDHSIILKPHNEALATIASIIKEYAYADRG